jgi:hypothetical protein
VMLVSEKDLAQTTKMLNAMCQQNNQV